ncbi:MAG: hypothetical protein H7068_12865 [Pedobacter sp.]|nr:hypothetical protein [Chitinophagaceae bacterium]
MKQLLNIKKIIILCLFVISMQVALASISFTGIVDDNNKNKYSLKNLSSLSHRSLSLASFKLGLQFKGSDVLNQNGTEINSMLRFDKGNTTYIMPYKFKVKVPKFKAPSNPVN